MNLAEYAGSLFELRAVVVHWHAPLRVVVGGHQLATAIAPGTTLFFLRHWSYAPSVLGLQRSSVTKMHA